MKFYLRVKARSGKCNYFLLVKMKTKTKIEKQLQKKTNSDLVETIVAAKKNKEWQGVAAILAGSRKNHTDLNLDEIEKKIKEKDIAIVPGKVLSQGEISKKLKVVALGFSEKAKEKLLNAKCEVSTIMEEIKKNPDGKGIVVLKK